MNSRLIALTGLLVSSLSAHAALDNHSSFITDTDTNLDWLKLTETDGLSFNYVASRLGAGQEFEGWQYATSADFETLLLGQGATAMFCGGVTQFCGSSLANNGIGHSLINLLGDLGEQQATGVQTDAATYFSYGLLADVNDIFSQRVGLLYDLDSDGISATSDSITTYATTQLNWGSSANTGSFLVRTTSEVPLPAGAILFGSALISLFGFKSNVKSRK